jgi:hypothetical protein
MGAGDAIHTQNHAQRNFAIDYDQGMVNLEALERDRLRQL